ncbi:MAG: sulfur carrier protein ThiS adenylyltransferase ThiF [Bacteroidales bacterium]|nr:sulfur carrier protein ThiS adenylyltransferase ThiF [Bacteroidales bacterium]
MTNDHHIRQKLKSRTVGIAGCGGLGSNCAVALARVGVGKLVIADFDKVDMSNLNRQYFFADQVGVAKVKALKDIIYRIDHSVQVEMHEIMLDEENIPAIFAACDVIVEAFDRAEMKQMIIETVSEKMPGKILVCGVGLAGWGKNTTIRMESFGNIYICGDMANEVTDEFPPLGPRVGIVANMQANQVLEILLGKM